MLLIVVACAQQPPERTPLPDVEEVLPEPPGCQLSIGAPRGARIASVLEGSPAAGALLEEDVLVAVGDAMVNDADQLVAAIGNHRPGDKVTIDYERDGEPQMVEITLAADPSDPGRPYLGVAIRTAYETIAPEEADDLVRPSPTARTIEIGGSLIVFDPLARIWQDTGIDIPEDQDWVSTTTGFYGATPDTPAVLFDLVTQDVLSNDGFEGWEPRRLIGSLGDKIILVVTSEVAEQPGFVNIAIAGFDPTVGETLWVSPVLSGFGIPVVAHGSPDASAFVVVGADQETGEELGVELWDQNGTRRGVGELVDLGSPIGWFDNATIGFRDEEIVSVLDPATGSATTFTLPSSLVQTRLSTVGDGRHVIAVDERNLVLDDLTAEGEVRLLAQDCVLGPIGPPGWGM